VTSIDRSQGRSWLVRPTTAQNGPIRFVVSNAFQVAEHMYRSLLTQVDADDGPEVPSLVRSASDRRPKRPGPHRSRRTGRSTWCRRGALTLARHAQTGYAAGQHRIVTVGSGRANKRVHQRDHVAPPLRVPNRLYVLSA
jgi:hypothetical protein